MGAGSGLYKQGKSIGKTFVTSKYQGIGVSGGEVHVEWMYTDTIYSFNSLK